MLCLISLSIILVLGTGPAAEIVPVDDFRAFFTALYNPSVHYDTNGRVLKEGSPLTAGHVIPDWANATVSVKSKGRQKQSVCVVPITVEREIWVALADDKQHPERRLAERELVLTRRSRDKHQLWSAVLRYCITDPSSNESDGFSGLIIDVDPNSFALVSIGEYRGGKVVLEEEDPSRGRWVRKKRPTIVQERNDLDKTFGSMDLPIHLAMPEGIVGYHVFMPGPRPAYSSKASYEPGEATQAIHDALARYDFFPVTVGL